MPSPLPRLLARRWLVAVAVLLLLLGGAVAFIIVHAPGNVSHPNLSFTRPATTATTTTTPAKPKVAAYRFDWPRYGFDAARTRDFAADPSLHPPFRVGWRFGGNALLEFPPVIFDHTLYFVDDGATVKAVDTLSGRQLWATHLGTLSAASPAVAARENLIIVPVLSDHGTSPGGGRIAALSMSTGRVVWSRPLPSGSESSPLVYGTSLYFGDQAGTVYSMNASTGHVNWTYQASGAVKAGPSLANGVIYFGDYAGRAYALNAATGHQVWAVSTAGSAFGFGSGNFYSTPAIAFGRVYMGNTDGYVYSFAANTGQLAWSTATGSYVYASPAVGVIPGLGPTVFMGSYSGDFYAFNAQSGAVRWSYPAGGRISGAATIVNNVVYFSVLGTRTTIGLDARTGKSVFSYPDGAFNPVVADNDTIYLSGYNTLYQMLPAGH
jgi:outer membrane protein assembly factor BamB